MPVSEVHNLDCMEFMINLPDNLFGLYLRLTFRPLRRWSGYATPAINQLFLRIFMGRLTPTAPHFIQANNRLYMML